MKNKILSDKEIAELIEKHEQPGYERNYIDSYGAAPDFARDVEKRLIEKVQNRMHELGRYYKGAGSTVEAWNDMVFWLRGDRQYCIGYDSDGNKK